ncbi:MAG: alpha-amylase family glycosyl hydrolase, partial [Anaerolineaceae bacterium]
PTGVRPGELHAVGLIDEISHYVISLYRRQKNPLFSSSLIRQLDTTFTADAVDELLLAFIGEFPPTTVFTGRMTAQEYLRAVSGDSSNREQVLEELALIWMANQNKAYQPLNALFNDQTLQDHPQYSQIIRFIETYSRSQPGFGPQDADLVQLLRSPALAVPDSIPGQLDYIRAEWGYLLGDYLLRILSSLDVLKEESKLGFTGPGPVEIPLYDYAQMGLTEEDERYSRDSDWMPNLVLIAKNSYVWLHQLSVQYQRPIRTLSDIPDEELQQMARRGINGLWLIGLWERSRASARIKQLCGNPEAISSAYALRDYRIADDLGGEQAYQNLEARARRYGIRLASDMVPNHMAIDSNWVFDHPDWFISIPYSPFPSYQFSGPDLSDHPDVGIMIDDHYYSRSDAAV